MSGRPKVKSRYGLMPQYLLKQVGSDHVNQHALLLFLLPPLRQSLLNFDQLTNQFPFVPAKSFIINAIHSTCTAARLVCIRLRSSNSCCTLLFLRSH